MPPQQSLPAMQRFPWSGEERRTPHSTGEGPNGTDYSPVRKGLAVNKFTSLKPEHAPRLMCPPALVRHPI